jgi:single-stranded DNA-binding protein
VSSVQLLGSRNNDAAPSSGGYASGGYQPAPAVNSNASSSSNDITEPFDDLPF